MSFEIKLPTIEDRIKEIEQEIKKTKYNKATESHIGLLKAKMARLQLEAESHKKSGGGSGFSVPKTGDATVALVGYPNVGKSSLVNAMTHSGSEVGNFAFTTLRVIPGILKYKGCQIQILDLPGIIENASSGSGRGREVLAIVRNADLVLLVTDNEAKGMDKIIEELRKVGIVLNRKRKNISMKRANTGGIRIRKPKSLSLPVEQIRAIAKEFKITNAELYIRESVDSDDLIDFFRGNVVYLPSMIAVNKIDLPHDEAKIRELSSFGKIAEVSASTGKGVEELKEMIYQSLSLVRVFLRDKSGKIDYERPLVLTEGTTVRDVCRNISREMLVSFKYAILRSDRSKVNDMRVGLEYSVADGDIITIVSRN